MTLDEALAKLRKRSHRALMERNGCYTAGTEVDAVHINDAADILTECWPPPAEAEVRLNDDGTLDEIVAHGAHLHLEQLGMNHWWLHIDGGLIDVRITLSSPHKIEATIEDTRGAVVRGHELPAPLKEEPHD